MLVQILDSTSTEIVSFKGDTLSQEKKTTDLTISRNLAMTNWQIVFSYPEELLAQDAINVFIPFAIVTIILYTLLVFGILLNKGQLPLKIIEKKNVSPEKK